MPTRCNRLFLLQILLLAQHVSGTIIPCPVCGLLLQQPANRTQPSAPHHTDNLKTKAPNTTGSNHLYNTLELLMMGIVVPETCWASNKICNKKHLLHLVGILFPHINDDARSKSLQIMSVCQAVAMVSLHTERIHTEFWEEKQLWDEGGRMSLRCVRHKYTLYKASVYRKNTVKLGQECCTQ